MIQYGTVRYSKMFDIHKTRMIGLLCGEEIVTICQAVSMEYRNASDKRTDSIPISLLCRRAIKI